MFLSILIASVGLTNHNPDTLSSALVSADRHQTISRVDTVCIDKLSATESIADALDMITGIQINDYGGEAGLKTLSIRGMGASHTRLYIDGIRLSSSQSGQVDLGTLALNNLEGIAIDYARSSVNLISSRPSFDKGRRMAGSAAIHGGSFNTLKGDADFSWKITPMVSMTIYGDYFGNDGNFKYDDGKIRQGNDITRFRAGVDLFGKADERNVNWHIKTGYNDSERGLPGSLSYPSKDRQIDRNSFIQGIFRQTVSDVYSFSAGGRFSNDKMRYISESYQNYYNQTSLLLTGEHNFRIIRWFSLLIHTDLYSDILKSDLYSVERFGAEGDAAAIINLDRFKAEASLNYIGIYDDDGQKHNCLSPHVSMKYMITKDLVLSASGRKAHRIPSFNDLYYPGIGNTELKTEEAWMTELGLDYSHSFHGVLNLRASIDGFYNYLTDKIISAPTENPEIWAMYNLDKVKAIGIDATAQLVYNGKNITAAIQARHTFHAGTVIPYQPDNKSSLHGSLSFRGWTFQTAWRWNSSSEDSYQAIIKPWNTVDASISKEWKSLTFCISGQNIFNRRYEIISGYPMPSACMSGGIRIRL